MRLLDTYTGQFVDFTDWRKVRYAILSHTWNGAEQTYQEVRAIQRQYGPDGHRLVSEPKVLPSSDIPTVPAETPTTPDSQATVNADAPADIWSDAALSEKVRRSCEIARSHGYRYLWIDSCCIDKTSSSELSEAINSMYVWYRDASVCYAYLSDVGADPDPEVLKLGFRLSRWFTRGWTLQELVAPPNIVFLAEEWEVIGTKVTLVSDIELVTGIESDVLTHKKSLDEVSVARRMCWAATRQTTRVEDQAYSLLGIFDINMPTLYGEGDRAFRRLQEEILKRIPDQSIFVSDTTQPYTLRYFELSHDLVENTGSTLDLLSLRTVIFAASPHGFFRTGSVSPVSHDLCRHYLGLSEVDHPLPDYTPSPYGLRTHFPILSITQCFPHGRFKAIDPPDGTADQWFLVILGCTLDAHHSEHLLARLCCLGTSRTGAQVLMGTGVCSKSIPDQRSDLFVFTPDDMLRFREHVEVKTVYIPHPDRALSLGVPRLPASSPDVTLSSWTTSVLEMQGYRIEHFGPRQNKPDNHQFAFTRDSTTLCLELQFSPFNCHLTVWFPRTNSDAPQPASTVLRPCRIEYSNHTGFAPIDMRTAAGKPLAVQTRFEAAEDRTGESLYFAVELGESKSYPKTSLPVLRVQDGARLSPEERTLSDSAERASETSWDSKGDSSSVAGSEEHGRHGHSPSRTMHDFGRKMDGKVKEWWGSRRAEKKAVP